MTTAITPARRDEDAALLEQVLIGGNLAQLSASQRVSYYRAVCNSLGLNHLTKPFEYMTLNGKLVLYAKKDCAEQLRERDKVSITKLEKEVVDGVYVVTAYARNKDSREDSDIGAVSIEGLKGEAKSNAMMKAITKAKRRVTLSICGLGFLDETEIDSIPDARPVAVNLETGEIVDARPVGQKPTPTASQQEYTRLYSKLIDLGMTPEKDGKVLPPSLPPAVPEGRVQAAVDYLRALCVQAEDMGQPAAVEAAA